MINDIIKDTVFSFKTPFLETIRMTQVHIILPNNMDVIKVKA